ncbi:MAG: hypothetical protein RL757_186 [Bacteroidota bacterium]|jgi:hypothetical protein
MGLDLYHVAPSKKMEPADYFKLDEFDDNPKFLQKHSHLIEELEEFDYNFDILVFSDIATKNLILDNNEKYRNKPTLIGDISNLTNEIELLVKGQNLNTKDRLILNHVDHLLTKRYNREIYYRSICLASNTPNIQKVLYLREKGYQRKGMNEQFYRDFINDKNYYDLKAVQKAAMCLEPTWGDSKEDLQRDFKKLFIDNFVEGESIFFASW